MLVANSFDLWRRDAFFSAAEEVQESADILESGYRTWVSVKREGLSSNDIDDLRRELQTALGTAKWQLEEFERAVRSSYGNCRDQNRMARHQQFVVAIESQIARAEDALRESLNEEGKQPFRWVNLDEDERDDLAMFLSGSSGTSSKSTGDDSSNLSNSSIMGNTYKKKDQDYAACSSSGSFATKGLASSGDDIVINMGQPDSIMEIDSGEILGTKGDVNCESDLNRSAKRGHASQKFGLLRVLIPGDQMKNPLPIIADTPKEKTMKLSNFLQIRGINCINKLFKGSSGYNSRIQISRRIQFGSSMRLIVFLLVSFFILGGRVREEKLRGV